MKNDQTGMPRVSWNKGKLVGQKAPLKLKDISATGSDLNALKNW